MIDVTFEKSSLDDFRDALSSKERVSVMECLELLETLSEDEKEEAMDLLTENADKINVADIPRYEQDEKTALRLKLEGKLAKSGQLMTGLEENDPLRLFLEELAAAPVAGDEKVLLAQVKSGDEGAAQQLAMLSLPRVVEMACRYAGGSVLLLDLIQEGCLGLWQGIMRYTDGDYEAHICQWIDRYLKTAALTQAHTDNVIYKVREGMADYRDADQRLLSELGRNPTLEEIAEAMHTTAEDAAVYASMLSQANARQQVERSRAPKEKTADDDQAVENTAYFQTRQRILEMLSTLTEQEAKLLTLRFGLEGGLPMDPQQAGEALGLRADEVIQMETTALLKLRQSAD